MWLWSFHTLSNSSGMERTEGVLLPSLFSIPLSSRSSGFALLSQLPTGGLLAKMKGFLCWWSFLSSVLCAMLQSLPVSPSVPLSIHPSILPSVHPFTSISPFPRLVNWLCWAHGKRRPLGTYAEALVCQTFFFNKKQKVPAIKLPHTHTQSPHTGCSTYKVTHTHICTHKLQLAHGQISLRNYLRCVESQWHLTTGVTTLFACWMGDLCRNVNPSLRWMGVFNVCTCTGVQLCVIGRLLFSVSRPHALLTRRHSDMGGVRGTGELEKILMSHKLLSKMESISCIDCCWGSRAVGQDNVCCVHSICVWCLCSMCASTAGTLYNLSTV